MQVKIGENKVLTLQGGQSYGGIEVIGYLKGANVSSGDPVPPVLNAQNINLKITVYRQNKTVICINHNMLLLATYCLLKERFLPWVGGLQLVEADGLTGGTWLYPAFIDFQTPLTLAVGESADVELTVNSNAVASCDTGVSFFDFYQRVSANVGVGTPTFKFDVIQSNNDTLNQPLMNNVFSVKWLNFDQTDWLQVNAVIVSVSLTSDQKKWMKVYYELVAELYDYVAPRIPLNNTDENIPANLYYPQTFNLYEKLPHDKQVILLTNASINASMNSVNVNASQNYIGQIYLTF